LHAFKLVDRDGYTRRGQSGETLWRVGEIVRPTGVGSEPCRPGVLHGYVAPEVAILANSVHANITNPQCLRVETVNDGYWETDGLKRWTQSSLRVVEKIQLPALPIVERAAWTILLAPHSSTRNWAIGWLSGRDRSVAAAAWTAARAARTARAAAKAAKAAAQEFEAHLMPVLVRARAILAGEYPAKDFDAPY
jgi:hypothetical protein